MMHAVHDVKKHAYILTLALCIGKWSDVLTCASVTRLVHQLLYLISASHIKRDCNSIS